MHGYLSYGRIAWEDECLLPSLPRVLPFYCQDKFVTFICNIPVISSLNLFNFETKISKSSKFIGQLHCGRCSDIAENH